MRMQVLSERVVAEAGDEHVAVQKAVLDLARDNIVGIKLCILSNADAPVTVSVVETFPDHLSMSDVQAHPSYHPEKWTISEGRHRMTFEAELQPNESIETIYGVRVADGNLDPYVVEPQFETHLSANRAEPDSADGAASTGGPASPTDSTATSGGEEASSGPSLEAEAASPATPDPGPDDQPGPPGEPDGPAPADVESSLDDPSDQSPPSAGRAPADVGPAVASRPPDCADDPARAAAGGGEPGTPDSEPSARDGSTTAPSSRSGQFEFGDGRDRRTPTGPRATDGEIDGLIEAMAQIELTGDQRAALREAVDLEPAESQRLQLAQLQSSVARLSAYADAFEELVDTVGSPANAISQLRSAHQELATAVEALADSVESAADQREDLRSRVEQLEADLATVRDDLSSELAATEDRLREDLTGEMVDRDAELREELEGTLQDRDARLRETLSTEIGALEDRLEGNLTGEIDALDGRVRELEAVLGAEEFEGIREVIAAEQAWRDRLESVRSRQPPASTTGQGE